MREQPPHPFDFATHPRSLDRALRSGDLTETDYVILVRLYGVANRATWIATLTLEQLAESIAWERSLDWLYRRLADLEASPLDRLPRAAEQERSAVPHPASLRPLGGVLG